MRSKSIILLVIAIFSVGCSDSSNENVSSENILVSGLSLNVAGGTEVTSESLLCTYRQATGSSNSLTLDFQFLSAPNAVAFALYLENPIPAMPFVVSAGQQGSFDFEVFVENAGYRSTLTDGEIEISLVDLPSPSELSDGDQVSLSGELLINQFTLPAVSATGDSDDMGLALEAARVDINCEAEFELSEVVI